jgi:predicted DNA-binding protein (MmcQ/YjbR family)
MDAEVVERQTHENISPSADFAKRKKKKKIEEEGMNRSTLCALTAAAHQLVMMGVVAIAMPKREREK